MAKNPIQTMAEGYRTQSRSADALRRMGASMASKRLTAKAEETELFADLESELDSLCGEPLPTKASDISINLEGHEDNDSE